jgi:nitroreductase
VSIIEVETMIEAASWAPSAMNEQPWRFAVARREDEEHFEKLASLLYEGNYRWAKHAAVLMVVVGSNRYERNGELNVNMSHDTGMATQNLLLQGVSMGIYGHVMEGFDKEKASESLDLGDGLKPLSMIAMGRLGDPDQLEEPYLTRELTERNRRSVKDSMLGF